MNKFAVGIPTINQPEYLTQCVNAVLHYLPSVSIFIYNNNPSRYINLQQHKNVKVMHSGQNIGVAASWNTMLTDMKSMGMDYGLMLNDDIVLSERITQIHEFINRKNKPQFARILNDWSIFLISMETFQKVGLFDENFYPAYFEDCDYQYRMKLAKIETDYPNFLLPAVYRTSSSIKADPSLNDNYLNNKSYYEKKWGGSPFYETYTKPFNK